MSDVLRADRVREGIESRLRQFDEVKQGRLAEFVVLHSTDGEPGFTRVDAANVNEAEAAFRLAWSSIRPDLGLIPSVEQG